MTPDEIEIHQVSDDKYTVVIIQLQQDGKANDYIKFISDRQMHLKKAIQVRDRLLAENHTQ